MSFDIGVKRGKPRSRWPFSNSQRTSVVRTRVGVHVLRPAIDAVERLVDQRSTDHLGGRARHRPPYCRAWSASAHARAPVPVRALSIGHVAADDHAPCHSASDFQMDSIQLPFGRRRRHAVRLAAQEIRISSRQVPPRLSIRGDLDGVGSASGMHRQCCESRRGKPLSE